MSTSVLKKPQAQMLAEDENSLPPIEPLHERWEPAVDPLSIDVPGLDKTAPVQDQIEYLEQMITIKLQNIDANFAKAHQILSTKILPAVKRFSVNTEPTREAARFWVSFYEQAAQVRIPTSDDFTEEFEEQTATQEDEPEPLSHGTHQSIYEEQRSQRNVTITPSESSFASGANLVSSTPMSHSQNRHASRSQQPDDSTEPWAHSLESPLDRLDRDLRSLTEEDESLASRHMIQASSSGMDTSASGNTGKGKGKGKQAPSLLQNVLSKNIRDSAQSSPVKSRTLPLQIKKTPKRNPYVPPNTRPADWDGIVDLTNTPDRSNKRNGKDVDDDYYSDDDSELSLPPGMSPPTTVDFARPPRSAQRLNLARTPAKQAAMRIGYDLVGNVERLRFTGTGGHAFGGAVESSMSTISSPSLSRHTRQALGMDSQTSSDPSLDSVMRRVGLNTPAAADDSFDDSSFDQTPNPAFFGTGHLLPEDGNGAGDDSDSSDSSFEEGNNGAPSAAFLMASQGGRRDPDDSFGSSNQSSDSVSDEEAGGGMRAIHPFAGPFDGMEDGLDDSFDDDIPESGNTEEATVFGTRAAQQQQPAAHVGGSVNEYRLKELRYMPPLTIPNTPTPLNPEQPFDPIKPLQ